MSARTIVALMFLLISPTSAHACGCPVPVMLATAAASPALFAGAVGASEGLVYLIATNQAFPLCGLWGLECFGPDDLPYVDGHPQ